MLPNKQSNKLHIGYFELETQFCRIETGVGTLFERCFSGARIYVFVEKLEIGRNSRRFRLVGLTTSETSIERFGTTRPGARDDGIWLCGLGIRVSYKENCRNKRNRHTLSYHAP